MGLGVCWIKNAYLVTASHHGRDVEHRSPRTIQVEGRAPAGVAVGIAASVAAVLEEVAGTWRTATGG
jgi:hypothetical protein